MMTIAEQILRAKDDYDAVYEAGKNSAGEVLKFTDVASTAYRSIVPNGVEPFAKVNKIGGMTYKTDEGLRSASVSELKSEGANLIPFPYNQNQSNTSNGMTYTSNEDGTVALNGTSTGVSYHILQDNIRLPEGVRVTLSGCPTGGGIRTYCLYINVYVDGAWKAEWYDTGNGVSFDTIKNGVYTVSVYGAWVEGVAHNNLVFKPMLNIGSTALLYKPYVGILDTLAIPEAVKSLEGYGLGVDAEYYNYIEWRDGRAYFVKKVERIEFNGTENWIDYGSTDTLARYWSGVCDNLFADFAKAISNKLDYSTKMIPNVFSIVDASAKTAVRLDKALYPTVDDWKAQLKTWSDNGEPFVIVGQLKTPIETDISAYLTDEYIEVEGGGTITAVNEYGYDAPTNISYLIDTQGG